MSPNAEEVAQVILEEEVPVVTTGAGNPEKYMELWKEKNIRVIPVVASLQWRNEWSVAVRMQWLQKGVTRRHIGESTTMTLVPQVVDAVQIPVIAAGGIADGRGMAAALMLGAKGVQIGTRFVATRECQVHQNYKDCILKAKDIDTRVTGRSTGHPVRALRNQMTRKYLELEKNGASLEELEYLALGALRKAVIEGNVNEGSVMSGQIAGLIREELTCEQVMQKLVTEADALLSGGWMQA